VSIEWSGSIREKLPQRSRLRRRAAP
jgi:hypothetical protein